MERDDPNTAVSPRFTGRLAFTRARVFFFMSAILEGYFEPMPK
jgi:hypothetical protein